MSTSTATQTNAVPIWLVAVLLLGDALAIVAFAVIGRSSHGMVGTHPLLATLQVAAPFAAAWLLVALVTVLSGRVAAALPALRSWLALTAITWAIGISLGHVLRALILGRAVPTFVIVTMIATGLLTHLWRIAFWLLFRKAA